MHCPVPDTALYVPAKHALHAAPSDVPLYPAKHLQSTLPDAELVPAGHVEHHPAPVAALNLPGLHALHVSPSDVPLYPAKQLQSIN